MGSLIIQEVVKDLLNKGLDNAKVLLLAGSRYVHVWTFCLWFQIQNLISKSTFHTYSCIGINKNMPYLFVQCGWYRGPSQRGPCGGAAGGTGPHWDTSARPVWFRLVPGQQAVSLHGLRGCCQLCPHWDHQERHQVWEAVDIIIKEPDFARLILVYWQVHQVANIDIVSHLSFSSAPSGTGEEWYQRGAGKPMKERSGTVSLDIESSHQ